jgi:hypothetical protein
MDDEKKIKVREFLDRVGRVYLGPREMDDPTAEKLLEIIDDIEGGKLDSTGLPKAWLGKDLQIKEDWIKKYGSW